MRSGTSLNIMGPSLYDGLLGISIFTAALYQLTGGQAYYQTAEHCIKKAGEYIKNIIPNMERYRMTLGYSNGIAGYISGLSLTSKYLEIKDGYELAESMIRGITQKMIEGDRVFDVLGGTSGLVIALTQEERWLKNPGINEHVLNLLKWCGNHLLAQQSEETKEGFKVWKSQESSQMLTGLGHGVSGIAMALLRLYEIFGEERFFISAKEAVAYENSVFDLHTGNWPDFRKDPKENATKNKNFMAGYCAGAPGIGLARLDYLKKCSNDEKFLTVVRKDIERADYFVRSMKNESRNHLCCGSAGRIDFLIEEGIRLEDYEAMNLAHRKLSDLVLGKQQRGHYNFHTVNGKYYYNPTLFQGTAGIGYEILRFIAPDKIQSILV